MLRQSTSISHISTSISQEFTVDKLHVYVCSWYQRCIKFSTTLAIIVKDSILDAWGSPGWALGCPMRILFFYFCSLLIGKINMLTVEDVRHLWRHNSKLSLTDRNKGFLLLCAWASTLSRIFLYKKENFYRYSSTHL